MNGANTVAVGGGGGGRGRDKSSRDADDTADACAFTKANTNSGTNGSVGKTGVTSFGSAATAAGRTGTAECINLLRTSVSSTVKAPGNGEEGAADEITTDDAGTDEEATVSGSAEIPKRGVTRAGSTGVADNDGEGGDKRGVGMTDTGTGGVGGRDVIAVYTAGN